MNLAKLNAGLAVLLTLGSTGSVASAQMPETEPLPPILFQTDRKGNSDIYAMNPDGSGQVPVLVGSANDEDPAWAPSGEIMAFSSDRDGTWQVYLADGDSAPVQLTQGPASNVDPVWSSDGSMIAFESDRNDNWDIFVMDAAGLVERPVTSSQMDELDPAWKPGSHTVAFDRISPPGADLFERDVDSLHERQLTRTGPAEFDPAYSPTGSRLAFDRLSGRHYDVRVLDLKSDVGREVAAKVTNALEPSWSPDGERILFTAARGRQSDIFRATRDKRSRAGREGFWNARGPLNLTTGLGAQDSGADWRLSRGKTQAFRASVGVLFEPRFECTTPRAIHKVNGWRVLEGTRRQDGLCGTWRKERLVGRRTGDRLWGDTGPDRLWGGAGGDEFFARDGAEDWLYGGVPPSKSSATDRNRRDKAWLDKSVDHRRGINKISP